MITVEIIGARECAARLKALTPHIRQRLKAVLTALGYKLAARVQSNRLSGQSLHVRTGTLRRSIKSTVEESGTKMTGVVYTPVVYAPVHEFGFQGVVTVKEHLRRITSSRYLSGTNTFTVRSHSRHMNIPQRAFMKPEFDLMLPEIQATISEAAKDEAKRQWEATR